MEFKNILTEKILQNILTEKFIFGAIEKIGLFALTVVGGLFAIKYIDHLIKISLNRLIELQMAALETGERHRAEIRKQTLTSIIRHAVKWGGYLIILLMALNIVGLDIRPVLATAGVASLAIGFGAQSLVKDVIAGFFVILEDQYGKGDVVELDGESGTVETLNLRTTHLRDAQGVLIVKSNGNILVVRNMTKDWARIDYKVGVSYSSDLNKVLKVMADEGQRMKRDYPDVITDEPEVLGVDSLNASDITIRMHIKLKPGQQWALKRELNKRIKERFDKEGIEIPFPQQTVWSRSPGN